MNSNTPKKLLVRINFPRYVCIHWYPDYYYPGILINKFVIFVSNSKFKVRHIYTQKCVNFLKISVNSTPPKKLRVGNQFSYYVCMCTLIPGLLLPGYECMYVHEYPGTLPSLSLRKERRAHKLSSKQIFTDNPSSWLDGCGWLMAVSGWKMSLWWRTEWKEAHFNLCYAAAGRRKKWRRGGRVEWKRASHRIGYRISTRREERCIIGHDPSTVGTARLEIEGGNVMMKMGVRWDGSENLIRGRWKSKKL